MICWNRTKKYWANYEFEGDIRVDWEILSKFSEDSKAKSPSNVAHFPPIIFFNIITTLLLI